MLHTQVYSPPDPVGPTILAIHGLTGHGARWAPLAHGHLADRRVVAPDLLGHGRSTWAPPWGIADNVDALGEVIDALIPADERPCIVVGHSYGGAIAVHLAHRRPDDVAALVLLDPAQGLDPEFALQVATDGLAHWDYADAEAAKSAKRAEGWAQIPDEILESEVTEHLVIDGDRARWRVCAPAAATAWSEMSRPSVLPPSGIPTTVVVADRVSPPFVRPDFLDGCVAHPESVRIRHVDCDHMVPLERPELTAELIGSAVWTQSAWTPEG